MSAISKRRASHCIVARLPALIPRGYGSAIPLPERSIRLTVPLAWPITAAETLDESDLLQLEHLVADYLGIHAPEAAPRDNAPLAYAAMPPRPAATSTPESILRSLILTYGVSEQESQTRETVKQLLPPWAHPTTDAGGNLVLHLGKSNGKPGIVLMAHMDELGFRVRTILPDGSLDLENKGGGSPAFYWGHLALVHTSAGMRAGVLELPDGYDSPSFHFPKRFSSRSHHVSRSEESGTSRNTRNPRRRCRNDSEGLSHIAGRHVYPRAASTIA